MYSRFLFLIGLFKTWLLALVGYSSSGIGLVGDGVTNDATALNTWIASIGSTKVDLVLSRGTYLISTNVVFPSNINVIPRHGAILKVSNGISVTGTNTKLDCGLWQCFDLSLGGTVIGTWDIVEAYPEWFGAKGDGVTDDTLALQKCIDFCKILRAKTILRSNVVYNFTTLTTYDYTRIIGQSSFISAGAEKQTVLMCTASTTQAILNTADHNKKAMLKNIVVKTLELNGKNGNTIALKSELPTKQWGASIICENVQIYGFGIGTTLMMNTHAQFSNCKIQNCGRGILFDAFGTLAIPASSFGNLNSFINTTIEGNNIGIEFYSDINNTFERCVIENNYIPVLAHSRPGGFTSPQKHKFVDCWFEINGFDENNLNARPWVVNSDIDISYNALGTNIVNIDQILFENCTSASNHTQTIPNFNAEYETYTIQNERKRQLLQSDDTIKNLYNRAESIFSILYAGASSAFRTLFKISNKGTLANVNFNGVEVNSATFTPSGGVETKQRSLAYSVLTNPQVGGAGVANVISSTAFMTVTVKHIAGEIDTAIFIISDYHFQKALNVNQVGTTIIQNAGLLTSISISSNTVGASPHYNKTLMIDAVGTNITNIDIKVTFLPTGIILGA